uniref:ORF1 n=1 Tax=Porphyromonas gingivalis TaxID=837 RepID=Q9ZAD6_PORGN|nr:ORF1 [Porphyromonas gingivalis] [Porphyromonas gingivalis ATCC 33277]
MSRAMSIVHSIVPKGFACQYIDLTTACALQILCRCNSNMPFHHKGIVPFEFDRWSTQSDSTCDVCIAIMILCSAIEEEYTFSFDYLGGFGCGAVMDDSTMILIAAYRIETNSEIEGLSGTECCELFTQYHFVMVATGFPLLFQPHKESGKGNAITYHSGTNTG